MSTGSTQVDEILSAVRISKVWTALGGDSPKHGRAPAFFRDGNNKQAISLDDSKDVWYDHARSAGGGVLDLVQLVRGGDRQAALKWVAEFAGIPLHGMRREERRSYAEARRQQETDKRAARWWSMAAVAIADELLETMGPCDPDRASVTSLLATVRNTPLDEYRAWREQFPELTAALVHAGQQLDERLQRMLAAYLISEVRN